MTNDSAQEKEMLSTMDIPITEESSEFLVRSKSEILRILDGIMTQQTLLSVHMVGAERPAFSALVQIDVEANALILLCPPEWKEYMERPDSGSAMLVCPYEDSKIQFQGSRGVMDDLGGIPVMTIPAPTFMWRFQRRRATRYKAGPALKIILNFGFSESEAEVADLSMSGVGAVNCENDVKLDPGEILRECSIALPGVGKILVDLQVRHQTAVPLSDGGEVMRVGCQFMGLRDDTRQLISHYIEALSGDPSHEIAAAPH